MKYFEVLIKYEHGANNAYQEENKIKIIEGKFDKIVTSKLYNSSIKLFV